MSPEPALTMGNPQSGSKLGRAIRIIFSFRVMLAAGLASLVVYTISSRFNDPDLWFHLKLGQIVWNTHSIPSTDIFSYTAYGHSWTAHEWLAELFIYAAYRLGGYTGLMLWFAVVSSLLFILVFFLCDRYCGNALVSFMGALCAWFFGTVGLAIRPHLIGYIFLVSELLLLESASRNRRWLWALPPLFAVWVNCHGSYFFGIGVLVVYLGCSFLNGRRWGLIVSEGSDRESRKWLVATLALSVAALCLNPVGIHLLFYPLDTALHQKVGLNAVLEWKSPDLRTSQAIGMLIAALAIPAVALARRAELRLRDLALVAAGFALATQHLRMLFVFGIVVSPVLSSAVAPMMGGDRRKKDHPIANALFIAAFLLAMFLSFPGSARIQEQVRKDSPVAAVDYIRRARLSGPMLNEYVFGDYLIWAMPEHKVFIDGRGDVFDWTGVFAEFMGWASLSQDPNLLLNKRHIRFCLLRTDSPMVRVLDLLPGWRRAYSDHLATVFVRRDTI